MPFRTVKERASTDLDDEAITAGAPTHDVGVGIVLKHPGGR